VTGYLLLLTSAARPVGAWLADHLGICSRFAGRRGAGLRIMSFPLLCGRSVDRSKP